MESVKWTGVTVAPYRVPKASSPNTLATVNLANVKRFKCHHSEC